MIENSLNDAELLLPQLFDRAARLHSDAIALVYQERRISFFELQLYVEWMAGYFQTINLQPDQRVALLMDNTPQLVVSLFGLWRAGGVAVPLATANDDETLRLQLALAKVNAIVTTPEHKLRLDGLLAQSLDAEAHYAPPIVAVFEDDNIVTLDPQTRGRRTLSQSRKITRIEEGVSEKSGARFHSHETAVERLATVYFEAGRKYNHGTHEALAREAEAMLTRAELTPHDYLACWAPLTQENNLGCCLIAGVVAGATVILTETKDWDNLEKLFTTEGVTVAIGPAALLLRAAKNGSAGLAALRRYFYTDAVLSPEIGERLPQPAGLRIEQFTGTITTGILK